MGVIMRILRPTRRAAAAGIAVLGLVRAVAAQGLKPGSPRIGHLSSGTPGDANVESFLSGLRALGYEPGVNFAYIVRYAGRNPDAMADLAEEILNEGADVILLQGPASRLAVQTGKRRPTVIVFSGDPVAAGLVESFVKPGNNTTGISLMQLALSAKRVEILKEIAPTFSRLAVLYNPRHPGVEGERAATQAVADKLGLAVNFQPIPKPDELAEAINRIEADRCDGLIAFPESLMQYLSPGIAEAAINHQWPTIFGWRVFVDVGGLAAYGPDLPSAYIRAAGIVDKILRGTKPADLPIEQPTVINLALNQRTAGLVGVKFPPALLARADDVID